MDHRSSARIPVAPQCKAYLQLGVDGFGGVPVVNLGMEGCCLQVPLSLANALRDEKYVKGMKFIHPSLPEATLQGKVAWIEGQSDPDSGLVAAGVRFMAPPAGFRDDLSTFMRTWAQYERLTSDLDGMPA